MNAQLTPLIIILIGGGYLLSNLGIIPFTPWQILIRYWPVILIYHGLKNLMSYLRKSSGHDTGEIILSIGTVILGAYLLAPRIGINIFPITWSIVWPSILIILGVIKLIKKDSVITVEINGKTITKDVPHSYTAFVGDVRRRADSWVLDDTHMRHGIGSVELDLTRAIVPDREVAININGLIGEAVLYLPPDLPIKAECRVSAGDITVLGYNESGTQKRIHYQTPDYASSTRKLNIRINWKIGEIKIRRIG